MNPLHMYDGHIIFVQVSPLFVFRLEDVDLSERDRPTAEEGGQGRFSCVTKTTVRMGEESEVCRVHAKGGG